MRHMSPRALPIPLSARPPTMQQPTPVRLSSPAPLPEHRELARFTSRLPLSPRTPPIPAVSAQTTRRLTSPAVPPQLRQPLPPPSVYRSVSRLRSHSIQYLDHSPRMSPRMSAGEYSTMQLSPLIPSGNTIAPISDHRRSIISEQDWAPYSYHPRSRLGSKSAAALKSESSMHFTVERMSPKKKICGC